jgi:uncharacterized protein DUF4279
MFRGRGGSDALGSGAMRNCTNAAFRLVGPDVQPRRISKLLGRSPSYAHGPGERRNRVGQPLPNGVWLLSSEYHVLLQNPEDVEPHVLWLLDQISPVHAEISQLCREDGIHGDIYCLACIQGNGGVLFHPATLGRIAALGLELGLTIHYMD